MFISTLSVLLSLCEIPRARYNPAPRTRNAKITPLNRPSQYKPTGAYTWKLPSNTNKTKLKRYGNTYIFFNLRSSYKVSQSVLLLKISHRVLATPNTSPSKGTFEIYKPQGLFFEFYGICEGNWVIISSLLFYFRSFFATSGVGLEAFFASTGHLVVAACHRKEYTTVTVPVCQFCDQNWV